MALPAELQSFIPYDKSWLMRLGVLDLLADQTTTISFLENSRGDLSDDLKALLRASKQWHAGHAVDVGESGTLYRFLRFASWKLGREVQFIKRGTLADRPIVDDASIVDLPLAELLKLDNGTSQWASAAVLMGNNEPIPDALPYKLQLTYEARDHWQAAEQAGQSWTPRYDETIAKQAQAYVDWSQTGTIVFTPEQAEDYCFARAFDLMTAAEGEARWPALRQHESDRIAAMEVALTQQTIDSRDHRVVQAVAMRKGTDILCAHPDAVRKSWPDFWKMLETISNS